MALYSATRLRRVMKRKKAPSGWVAVVGCNLLHGLEVLHTTFSVTDCDLHATFVSLRQRVRR
jgi:hypothetical protein